MITQKPLGGYEILVVCVWTRSQVWHNSVMGDDGCYHVPVSPGQTMCGCIDRIVWLRFVISVMAEHIADLERRIGPTNIVEMREQ
jgi:hypothetical protein